MNRLAERREARGLTVEQASTATRIRIAHLVALEAEDYSSLPAPVFVRGYLKTYATYLDLDPKPLLEAYAPPPADPARELAIAPVSSPPGRLTLNPAVLGAIGLVVLAGLFSAYAYRQVSTLRSDALVLASPSPPALAALSPPPASALPLPSPSPHPVEVDLRFTDDTWIQAWVDGNAQYGDSGHVFAAGAEVAFTGMDVKVERGKGTATMVSIDGRSEGQLGAGVVTREFKAQA